MLRPSANYKEDSTTAKYMLSVHSCQDEVQQPMTEEEMQQSWQLMSALALLDMLDLDNYYTFHATRADLLERLDRTTEAVAAYARAASLAPTDAEGEFLARGGRSAR